MFWLQLCIYLHRHVHVCCVIVWYHWIQDSCGYKLILSAYLCDRNVEAFLWLNRSFTIIFISLPPREKYFLHFMISTSTFTTGSPRPLSRLRFWSPIWSTVYASISPVHAQERMSHNLSWACMHSPENSISLQDFIRVVVFFNPFNHKLLTKTFYSLSICTVKDANKFQAHKSVSRRMNFQMKSPQKPREVLWLLCLGTLCRSTQLHIVTKQESSVSSECFLFFSHNVKGNTTRRQLGQIFCSGRKRSTL